MNMSGPKIRILNFKKSNRNIIATQSFTRRSLKNIFFRNWNFTKNYFFEGSKNSLYRISQFFSISKKTCLEFFKIFKLKISMSLNLEKFKMVSQQWLNESIILNTRPDGQPGYIWEHQLDIIVPNEVKDRSAIFLHATNGNNPPNLDNPTPGDTKNTVKLAENLGIISERYSRRVKLMP